MNTRYGHARNNHPTPPITIKVEEGVITHLSITKKAIRTYTGNEIKALFEASGVGPVRISMLISEKFKNTPLSALCFHLNPGTYSVQQSGEILILPDSAYEISVEDQLGS